MATVGLKGLTPLLSVGLTPSEIQNAVYSHRASGKKLESTIRPIFTDVHVTRQTRFDLVSSLTYSHASCSQTVLINLLLPFLDV